MKKMKEKSDPMDESPSLTELDTPRLQVKKWSNKETPLYHMELPFNLKILEESFPADEPNSNDKPNPPS